MLTETQIDTLKKSVLFGSLPPDILDRLLPHSKMVVAAQGDTICRQGEQAFSVYCVVDGAVKLTVLGRNGQEVVVDVFHAGTSFAEALMFRETPYPVSAIALSDSKVVAVKKSALETELAKSPDVMSSVLSATYTHLHRLVRQIETLKASSGLQRVAGFILALDDVQGGTNTIRIPYEKQTLASLLGIMPETLSRAFKRLSQHGIQVNGPVVKVNDRKALETFLSGT